MRRVRFVLVGLGNLGRRFCEILLQKEAHLGRRYGLGLSLVGAADSHGAAYAPGGLDLARVIDLKGSGSTIARYPETGRPGWSAVDLVSSADAELLLEASPVNLSQGAEPGLSCIRTALRRGMHVITPNKGPMVLACTGSPRRCRLRSSPNSRAVAYRRAGSFSRHFRQIASRSLGMRV